MWFESFYFLFLALLGVASTSGYQMVVNEGEAKEIKDMAITSLQLQCYNGVVKTTVLKKAAVLWK